MLEVEGSLSIEYAAEILQSRVSATQFVLADTTLQGFTRRGHKGSGEKASRKSREEHVLGHIRGTVWRG